MFEAVLELCLSGEPDTCREVLLPGFEASSKAGCEARLDAMPGPASTFADLKAGTPVCKPVGGVADFEEISTGVFAHRGHVSEADAQNFGDVSNTGFIIGETSVVVIDTGGSRKAGEQMYRAIRTRTDLPISHVILTHMHPDHVLGASVFAEAGAALVGHAGLERALADRAESYLSSFGRLIGPEGFIGTRVVLPDIGVSEKQSLDIGGRIVTLQAHDRSHTGADLTVFDEASGILFAGDLVFDEHAPALDGSVIGWQSVLADLQAMPLEGVVPGHGGPLINWPEGGADLSRYLDLLASDTRAAIRQGDSLSEAVDEIAIGEAGNWALFDLFNPRNATVAYTELEWE